jgi:hypothetical protein
LKNGTEYASDETLYGIWVGINDVGLLLTNHNNTASIDVLMHRYRQLIVRQNINKAKGNSIEGNLPTHSATPLLFRIDLFV